MLQQAAAAAQLGLGSSGGTGEAREGGVGEGGSGGGDWCPCASVAREGTFSLVHVTSGPLIYVNTMNISHGAIFLICLHRKWKPVPKITMEQQFQNGLGKMYEGDSAEMCTE